MDRHDVSQAVNAENVAQLHKEDLKIQHQFNCRGLTYWYDDIKKIAFCLIEAPDKDSIHNMHKSAHGEVPNQIIEVDEHIVESFLGRIEDPVTSSSTNSNHINDPAQRTLMVVRYTIYSHKGVLYSPSDKDTQQLLTRIGERLSQFGGRLTNHTAGYLLISFQSTSNAVLCALKLERLFNEQITELHDSDIHIKIGLATGVPVVGNKTFFEDTINMANRLSYMAKSNIIMTTEVYNLFVTENPSATYDKSRIYILPVTEENYLSALFDFIENEWHNDALKVEDFEKPLGMSRTQVYRKVMFLTGKSPNSFLKEYRLKNALELIHKNRHTISEIAFKTGFNSQAYFSRCFNQRYGQLPSVYTKSYSNTIFI